VEANPVNARLCARPEEWSWSSAHDRAAACPVAARPVAAGILPAVSGGFQPPDGW